MFRLTLKEKYVKKKREGLCFHFTMELAMRNWARCTVALFIALANLQAQGIPYVREVLVSQLTLDNVNRKMAQAGYFVHLGEGAPSFNMAMLERQYGYFIVDCGKDKHIPVFILFPREPFLLDKDLRSELVFDGFRALAHDVAALQFTDNPVLKERAELEIVRVMLTSCRRPEESVEPAFFLVFSLWKNAFDDYKMVHQRVEFDLFRELAARR